MSDLTEYRDRSLPLSNRLRKAANDNLESEELDGLLHEFADELDEMDNLIAELNHASTENEYTDTDQVWALFARLRQWLTGLPLDALPCTCEDFHDTDKPHDEDCPAREANRDDDGDFEPPFEADGYCTECCVVTNGDCKHGTQEGRS
jgi:hypothetical protein